MVQTKTINKGADDNFVTDAEKTVIGNTSGMNTGDETATRLGALIGGAEDATPNDTDFVATSLTAAGILKKITWTNVKAFLKTYFDTLYSTAVKATGAELDTGTDDAKFATAKATKDSHNVPNVAPSTDGKVLTSNGTDWVSEVPAGDATKLPLAGGTMTGDIQLGETDIKLDAVLSGDEKWSGIVIPVTLGSTVAQGEVCFLASDGKWDKNDGILDGTDTGFSKQLGICLVAGDDTDASEMLLYGKVRSAGFPPTFTVGAPVYLDDTAGNLVVAQPSTTNFAIRIVGYAISATDLMFNPANDWMVHV